MDLSSLSANYRGAIRDSNAIRKCLLFDALDMRNEMNEY
jgi:hypothetical protein